MMKKKWTMEQRLCGQNQRAKQQGAKHNLTMEQWLETLEYFDYKCAYCGGENEVIEHYLLIYKTGTTVSNCVPTCLQCNIMKDKQTHDLSLYQNKNILQFIESKGVKISFHVHTYEARKKEHVILYCGGCGNKVDVPDLSIEDANAYIDQFFSSTGYSYISK